MKINEILNAAPKGMTMKQKLGLIVTLLAPLLIGTLMVLFAWNTFIVHVFPSMPEVVFIETLNLVVAWKYLFSD